MLFCRFDSVGHLDWIRQTKGNSQEFGVIGIDPVGNLYTTGTFRSSDLRFGPVVLSAEGMYSIFIAKLDTTIRPSLASVRSQSSLLLSWNPLFSGFHLESSDECCNPSGWAPYSAGPSTTLETNTVEAPLTGSPHYFRLAKP